MSAADATGSFEETGVLAEARERAGLTDFGDESFREPLRVLLQALEKEAALHAFGRKSLRARVVESLVARLRAQDWFRRHPEILEEPIGGPLVVLGLGRSGTTLLQRLLACDPNHYAALWWEVRSPSPYPGTRWPKRDRRIAEAEEQVRMILETSPEQAAMHPWDPTAPDEEIMLLEHSFLSHVPEAFANVPSYRRWLDDRDFTPAYRELRAWLQFLQWQKRRRGESGQRWVLKTPAHLGYLPTLFSVFPEARVILTHRDPLATVPSAASMNVSLWKMGSDAVDPLEAGRQWKERLAWGMARCLETRDREPADRFVDVWYEDLLADPLEQVRRIYASGGESLSAEAEAAMEQWLEENARDKRPAHEYTLAEFGFRPEEIERDFAAYRERFITGR